MTPAERLRAAADLIERTGAAVPAGPLNVTFHIDSGTTQANDAIAAWIALVGPDTAPALAAWLRAEADRAGDADDRWYPHALSEALAFADLILRGQQ